MTNRPSTPASDELKRTWPKLYSPHSEPQLQSNGKTAEELKLKIIFRLSDQQPSVWRSRGSREGWGTVMSWKRVRRHDSGDSDSIYFGIWDTILEQDVDSWKLLILNLVEASGNVFLIHSILPMLIFKFKKCHCGYIRC